MSQIKIIGHRGACGLAPENTLESLKKALEYHVDEIEIDVRVTKNHIPVLAHDKSIRDAAGDKLSVVSHTYAELKAHKPDLLTLEEALVAVRRRVPVVIEIKPGASTGCIIKTLNKLLAKGLRPEDIRIASFKLKVLKQLHKAFPELPIVVNDHWSGVRAAHRARKFRAMRIALSRQVLWGGYIRAASRSKYELASFTVNNKQKADKWFAKGLSAVYTDVPDIFERKADMKIRAARPRTNPPKSQHQAVQKSRQPLRRA